jgi:hypothetical protein
MAGYIFALTTGTGEVKYIFYEIAIALIKARDYHLILIRHRVADDGSTTTMTIYDPLNKYQAQYTHAQ